MGEYITIFSSRLVKYYGHKIVVADLIGATRAQRQCQGGGKLSRDTAPKEREREREREWDTSSLCTRDLLDFCVTRTLNADASS